MPNLKSLQETFDLVLNAIRQQGQPSIDPEDEGCLYRGPNGLKCPVGHLIPDNLYDSRMEGGSANSDAVAEVLENLGYNVEFCNKLQEAHDNADNDDFIYDFNRRMRRIAQFYKLEYREEAAQP